MILRSPQDVEEQDVGDSLGIPDMGVKIKWLIHNRIGDSRYKHNFALRRFTFEPGKSFTLHSHKYVEGVYIISGRGYFATQKERVAIGPGDVIYTASEEPHSLGAAGDEPLILLCCIDCIDGGQNCLPEAKGGIHLYQS